MIHHKLVTSLRPLKSIIPVTDGEKRLHHIFLHIRTGVLLLLKHLKQSVILVSTGYSGDNGKSLHTLVSLSIVVRIAVARPCPSDLVDRVPELLHLSPIGGAALGFSDQITHIRNRTERQAIPHRLKQAHIPVVAPVAPVPVAIVPLGEAIGADLISRQISFDSREDLFYCFLVPCVHVICPESVRTDGRKHLARQFHSIISGNR